MVLLFCLSGPCNPCRWYGVLDDLVGVLEGEFLRSILMFQHQFRRDGVGYYLTLFSREESAKRQCFQRWESISKCTHFCFSCDIVRLLIVAQMFQYFSVSSPHVLQCRLFNNAPQWISLAVRSLLVRLWGIATFVYISYHGRHRFFGNRVFER